MGCRLSRIKTARFIPRSAEDLIGKNTENKNQCRSFPARASWAKIIGERAGIRRRLKSLSIIHDDFHAQNIIISPDQKSIAIIDFDKAKIDDPLDDVEFQSA